MKGGRVKDSLRRFTTIGSVIDMLRNQRIAFLDPEKWDDRNDAEFMRLYREARGLSSLRALCCTESSETYHHWRVFTHASDGCFIDLVKQPLLDSIDADDAYFYAPMEYVRFDDMVAGEFEIADLPFLKRAGFKPEMEFRIIYVGDCGGDAHFMPIEPGWIRRIVLNPWLPAPVADSIKATLREIGGNPHMQIATSRLTNSQTWARYGRQIVERKV